MMSNTRKRILFITYAATVAALYVVLTWLMAAFDLSGQGAVQLRLSEMLCILPYFTTAAIPGLTLGCLLANLLTGAMWQDVVFGTLATLLGALGSYLLRRFKWLTPLPPILANTIIIPFVLKFAYQLDDGLWFLFLTVFGGEVLSVYLFGMLLLFALEPHRKQIFKI